MEQTIGRNRIFREVDMLNRPDQLYLLYYLAKTIAKSEEKNGIDIAIVWEKDIS